eukprot:CAMPEP_0119550960 /NCGR_PEP_ID=MMETSP1352-20130426/4372_1 /TAXON_ID=265584 /ORGANISM="Stauroneis constricta, Strain CCMP1120" /LENGTH=768 /DNA_ID=CAMNT_0007596955 /DNA_START=27 /DNA_END=2333 /DNA_ORIENTATION=-
MMPEMSTNNDAVVAAGPAESGASPASMQQQQQQQRQQQQSTVARPNTFVDDASTSIFLPRHRDGQAQNCLAASVSCESSDDHSASSSSLSSSPASKENDACKGSTSGTSKQNHTGTTACNTSWCSSSSATDDQSWSSSRASRHQPQHVGTHINTVEHGLPDTSEADRELAHEFGKLSFQQRNHILEDIHGVASKIALTKSASSQLESAAASTNSVPRSSSSEGKQGYTYLRSDDEVLLHQMQVEIKKLHSSRRSAYDQAAFLAPHRVELNDATKWLWLAFLRSIYDYHSIPDSVNGDQDDRQKIVNEKNNKDDRTVKALPKALLKVAQQAAAKMALHYQVKLELFGFDNVCKMITLCDHFTPEEIRHIQVGGCQPVSHRDSAGRRVLFVSPMLYDWAELNIMLKKLYYTVMTMLRTDDDLQLQIGGLVTVFYFLGSERCHPLEFAKIFSNGGPQLLQSLPFRDTSMHACYDHVALKPLLYVIPKIIESSSRLRFQAHFGSETECMYKLKTFGIPVEAFPLQGDRSRIDSTYYIKYINDRCEMERNEDFNNRRDQGDNAKGIEFPTEHCVLLGRGRTFQTHPGNLKLAALIESCMNWHKIAGRYGEKATISKEILQTIRQNGGRFLKRDAAKQMWVEVAESVAFEKVMYGFRTKTKRSRALHQHAAATGASSSLLPSSTTKTKKKQKMDHHNTTYQQAPSISAQLLFLSQNTATPSYPTAVVPPNGFPHPSNEMVTAEALRGGPLVFNMPHGDDGTKVVGGTGGGFVMQ